jgi:hypothetical protein
MRRRFDDEERKKKEKKINIKGRLPFFFDNWLLFHVDRGKKMESEEEDVYEEEEEDVYEEEEEEEEDHASAIKRLTQEILATEDFSKTNLLIAETIEEYWETAHMNDDPTFALTLKGSGMTLWKVESPLGWVLPVNKLSEILERKESESEEDSFAYKAFQKYRGKTNVLLALFSYVKDHGDDKPYPTLNGFVLGRMGNVTDDTEIGNYNIGGKGMKKNLISQILLMRTYPAVPEEQFHMFNRKPYFGATLLSIMEDIMRRAGRRHILIESLKGVGRFYEKFHYIVGDDKETKGGSIPYRKDVSQRELRNPPPKWSEILKERSHHIPQALQLTQGNTAAAAQLVFFYLKRKVS